MNRLLLFFALILSSATVHAQSWCRSQFDDQRVSQLRFQGVFPLSSEDYRSSLNLTVGQPTNCREIEAARASLMERKIFEHVDVEVARQDAGLAITFLLVPRLRIGTIKFSGGSVEESVLRRVVRLRAGDSFRPTALTSAVKRLRTVFRERGYFEPKIDIELFESKPIPDVGIRFHIDEGPRSRVKQITIDGVWPSDVDERRAALLKKNIGRFATLERIKRIRQQLLAALRSEGYLQASLSPLSTSYDAEVHGVVLQGRVRAHEPLSIVFAGNTVFSPEELLSPLQLTTRTVPYSPRAIPRLCRDIEELYQREGYFFANVRSKELEVRDGRRIFSVEIEEGQPVHLGEIYFSGDSEFPEKALVKKLETRRRSILPWKKKPDGLLVRSRVARDLATIEEAYHRRGYRAAKASVEFRPTADPSMLDLYFSIDEGKQERVASVEVRWKSMFSQLDDDERIFDELIPKVSNDEPLDVERLQTEQRRLAEELVALGYPASSVEVRYSLKAHRVIFEIDRGPRIRVGRIALQGNVDTHDRVLERELVVHEGDILNLRKIARSEENLYQTGLFRSVEVKAADGSFDSPVEDLNVLVSERESGSADAGVALDTEDGLHLFGQVRQNNFRGNGDRVLFAVDGYYKSGTNFLDAGTARATFVRPRIWGTRFDLISEVFSQFDIRLIDQYRFDRWGISQRLRTPVGEHLSFEVKHGLWIENLYDVVPDGVIGQDDDGSTLFSLLSGTIDYDRRDDALNPRQGYRIQLSTEATSNVIASDVNFLGVVSQQSVYIPVWESFVLANNFLAEFRQPLSDTETIPISHRFFLGGRTSMRGFDKYSVGPRGADGDIIGGDSALLLNSELQYRFQEGMEIAVFVDTGQSYLVSEGSFLGDSRGPTDWRYSPGLSLRYRTPVGPLTADVGYNPDREPGERRLRFYFGIGGAF